MMARRGRPRKMGKRKPCGRLTDAEQRAMRKDVRTTVMEQPHRRWLDGPSRRDQRAETEIGRLYLAGMLTEPKYWAAERWRSIVEQFHVVMATPVRPGSQLGGMVASGVGQDEESGKNELETDEERHRRVLWQHGLAMAAIRSVAYSASVFEAMERVILDDRPCTARDLVLLDRGISALCHMWKMTEERPGDDPARRVRAERVDRPSWPHDEKEVSIVYGDG